MEDTTGSSLRLGLIKTYRSIQVTRANRKRQSLSKDSKKLVRLEAKLSGHIKCAIGNATNKLVDVDLSRYLLLFAI